MKTEYIPSILLYLIVFLVLIFNSTIRCFSFEDELPFSIRILLESAVRNCDNFQVCEQDVHRILDWKHLKGNIDVGDCETEISFKPARVILQDFTGVPAVVDFAAMRDAVLKLGGNRSFNILWLNFNCFCVCFR